jgi:hypothetical protein
LARLPKIPSEAFSILGPVPVILKEKLLKEEEAHGMWSSQRRDVLIDQDEGSSLENQWMSYWHECSHIALSDTGATTQLDDKHEELVCDAMGGYLTAMMKAGYLKVTKPRTKE